LENTKKRKPAGQRHSPIFFIFLFPSVFAFIMVLVVPFVIGVYYSFTDWRVLTGGAAPEWVGLQNYIAIFQDITFLYSFLITTVYAVINIFILNVAAFSLALLVTSKLKLTKLYRAAFFLPNLIGGLILGYIWQFIFNSIIPQFGRTIGWEWLANTPFLGNQYLALMAIIIVGTWQYAGYLMMIYVASIQGIPSSLPEAAAIDGANFWHRLRHITFPLVAPAFTVSMFLSLLYSFRQFDVNIALTDGMPAGIFMGGAVRTTEFLALNIFTTAFTFREIAQGQAKAVVFFITLVIISLIQVRINKRREIEM
jgi:raffinose/stachyose/melibiose transport system permease protein